MTELDKAKKDLKAKLAAGPTSGNYKRELGEATLRLLDAFEKELNVQKGRSSFGHRPQAFDTAYMQKAVQADRTKVHGGTPDVDEEWRQKTAAPKPSADVAKVFDKSSPEAATEAIAAQKASAARHGADMNVRQSEVVGGLRRQSMRLPGADPKSMPKPQVSGGLDADVRSKPNADPSHPARPVKSEPHGTTLENKPSGASGVRGNVSHPLGENVKPAGDEDVDDESGPGFSRKTPRTDSESATGNPRAPKIGDPNPTGGRIVHPRYHRR